MGEDWAEGSGRRKRGRGEGNAGDENGPRVPITTNGLPVGALPALDASREAPRAGMMVLGP